MACTICSSSSTEGIIDREIALFSIHDIKDKRSAAMESDRRIWSKEISHVAATEFFDCAELLYRVPSRNSRLRRLMVSSSVFLRRDRYSWMEICIAFRYAAACAIAKGKYVNSFNNAIVSASSSSNSFCVNDLARKASASFWSISWSTTTSLPTSDIAISLWRVVKRVRPFSLSGR